jgi:catechol 2,3-dioxygenase
MQYYSNEPIPPETRVGHVHFIVADLERSVAFYRDVLGFHITEYMPDEPGGRRLAFLSANDYHNHVSLMEMKGVKPPPPGSTGLYHVGFCYPSRRAVAQALKRVLDCGHAIEHCHDYGIGEAVILRDPDGIPLELYYDRPASEWPRIDGQLRMFNKKVEQADLLAELNYEPAHPA